MADQAAGTDGGEVPEAPLLAIGPVILAAAIVGGAVEGTGGQGAGHYRYWSAGGGGVP